MSADKIAALLVTLATVLIEVGAVINGATLSGMLVGNGVLAAFVAFVLFISQGM